MPRKTPSKKSPKRRSTKGSTDADEPSTSLGTVFRESGGLAAIVAAAAVGVKAGYAHYVLLVLVLYVVTNEGRRNAVVHWWCRALRPFTPNQRRAFWLCNSYHLRGYYKIRPGVPPLFQERDPGPVAAASISRRGLALVRGAGPVAVRAAFRKGRPAFGRFAGAAVYRCALGSMSEKDDVGRLGDGRGAFTGRRRRLPALISTHRRIIITLPASAASARERFEPPLVITFIISVMSIHRR